MTNEHVFKNTTGIISYLVGKVEELSFLKYNHLGEAISINDIVCEHRVFEHKGFAYVAVVNGSLVVGDLVFNTHLHHPSLKTTDGSCHPISLSHLMGEPVDVTEGYDLCVTALVSTGFLLLNLKCGHNECMVLRLAGRV